MAPAMFLVVAVKRFIAVTANIYRRLLTLVENL